MKESRKEDILQSDPILAFHEWVPYKKQLSIPVILRKSTYVQNYRIPMFLQPLHLAYWGHSKMATTLADDTFKYKFVNESFTDVSS